MTSATASTSRRRAGQKGFTLVEVMVSLWIVTFAMVSSLTIIGSASEDVIDTIQQRKMRYLMQLRLGDIMVGPRLPEGSGGEEGEEELQDWYEEGQLGDFEDFASPEFPDEFLDIEWHIPVFRDEVICGAADEETLLEAGFMEDAEGNIVGRPVTNDMREELEEEGGPTQPPGQIKRVLVFVVRHRGEEVEDDREFTVMTWLPYPGEEEQQSGEEGEGGAGGAGGGEPGAGGDGAPGGSRGSDSITTTGSRRAGGDK